MIFNYSEFICCLGTISGQSSDAATKKLFNIVTVPATSFSMQAFKWVALMVPVASDLKADGSVHPLSSIILEKLRIPGWYQWATHRKPTVEWCMKEDNDFKVYYTFPVGLTVDTKIKVSPGKKSSRVSYKASKDSITVE